MNRALRVLLVDLNNFARYPTVAIGYICAALRQAGFEVELFSPLATGVTGVVREPPTYPWSLLDQRLRYWSAVSRNPTVRRARTKLAAMRGPKLARQASAVAHQFRQRQKSNHYDAALISTYLMYRPLCEALCRICAQSGVPVLVGGPYFTHREVVSEWINIEGIAGIVGGEVEPVLPKIVERLAAREDLCGFPGIWTRGRDGSPLGCPAPPLATLDDLPFPDYSDFPWQKYPNRIVPVLTGRGCGWGACTFCSDVASSAGRTFRSRSLACVLGEIHRHYVQYATNLFVMVDLKLNSNLEVWHALIDGIQVAAPAAQWVAAVHIGARQPNGLSADELKRARNAGLVRLTTGLESGSPRVLRRMGKGVDLHETSRCLRDAAAAGISVRTTMIIGYPGEDADDVRLSARFLEDHADCIERVSLNRFQIMTGTRFHRRIERRPDAFSGVTQLTVNHQLAQIDHHYTPTEDRDFRQAATRLLRAAHRINRKPLLPAARAFEGVM